MRKIFTLLFIIGLVSANAAPTIKLKQNKGKWTSTSTWDLGRLPQSGDTVYIPSSDTLIIDQNLQGLDNMTLYIKLYGALYFDGGAAKLALSTASTVMVYSTGKIFSSINNSQILQLGSLIQYRGTSQPITGPSFATSTTPGFLAISEAPIALPVKFLGFSAARKNADVLVQWATSQEVNADYFEVERSENGSTWNAIGKVKAAGNTNYTTNYSYTDYTVGLKTVYYRIKQVDFNGRFEYTAIRTVKADANTTSVNALASRGNVVLQFSKQVVGQVEVRLVSLSGQVVSRQLLNKPVGQLVLPAAVKGNYILTVSNQDDIQLNKQIQL